MSREAPGITERPGLSVAQIGSFPRVRSSCLRSPGRSWENFQTPSAAGSRYSPAACIGGFSLVAFFIPLLCLSIAFGLRHSVISPATSACIADLRSPEARAMGMPGSIMDIGHTAGPVISGLVALLLRLAAPTLLPGQGWFSCPTPCFASSRADCMAARGSILLRILRKHLKFIFRFNALDWQSFVDANC